MSDTQAIKDKIDIADLVGEYVQLKPAGVNKKGLCPFHHEKSPSFMVNSERQSWHCFGCAKGGDIFSFIEEIEGMEFIEALKFLANRAGVQLTNTRSDVHSSQKNRIKDINAEAARFFYQFLIKMPAAEPARAYLKRRGLKDETIDAWSVGFISDQWDLLTKYFLKKGFGIDDLVASGLTIKRDGADNASGRGFYDRFRGRVMFPLWDVHGTVVGFTGRVLVETENSGGKYVNTPQTLVYDKSRVVFGLNFAKQEIKRKDLIVMVEGQMDVIACHQAGMTNVVATSGTALTAEQIQLLRRYSSNLAIAFDADAAGVAAAKRGIDLALSEGMNIRVIRIPEGAGKDPDECLQKNPVVWFKAVEDAHDIMEWYFAKAFTGKAAANPKEKQHIVNELLPEIGRIPYAVERDHWLRELSARLSVDVGVLKEDMQRLKKMEKVHQSANTAPAAKPQPERQRFDILLDRLFALLVSHPLMVLNSADWAGLSECLSTHRYLPLYDAIKVRYTQHIPINIEDLRDVMHADHEENPVDTLAMQGNLLFSESDEDGVKRDADILLAELKKEWRKTRLHSLQQAIKDAEQKGDTAVLEKLYQEFGALR